MAENSRKKKKRKKEKYIGRDVDLLFRFRFTAPEIARLRIQPAYSTNGVYVRVTKAFQVERRTISHNALHHNVSTERVSPTEGPLYKRDEHYRSVSSQWEIMHPLEETNVASPRSRKENTSGGPRINCFASFLPSLSSPSSYLLLLPPPLFGNTSSHGASRQLFQRLLAVSQTHPFVSQPFTWFLGSFNPLRSFGISLPFLSLGVPLPPFLHDRLIFKSRSGHGRISMDLFSRSLRAISIVLIIESVSLCVYSVGFQN